MMNDRSVEEVRKKQFSIQLQQKIIHYKSELSKYKRLNEVYKKKIEFYENTDPSEKETVKTDYSTKSEPLTSLTAYFNYSVFLPEVEEADQETLIVGNFHIINTGHVELTEPFIGLRITPANRATISGKISLQETPDTDTALHTSNEEWHYMHSNWKEKIRKQGEYWLSPVHCQKLNPGETLSFTNFDLRLKKRKLDENVKIEGVCFSSELTEGIAAINHISFY
ncbi:hypothetical protein ACM26V_09770 [Salipaludibacillus sp. HK11]|uniref:hypothetical protein n=1 Tax=Salipaludibacillus sp. HK11 TaxID=3394320 RepID=UPI0039FCDC87